MVRERFDEIYGDRRPEGSGLRPEGSMADLRLEGSMISDLRLEGSDLRIEGTMADLRLEGSDLRLEGSTADLRREGYMADLADLRLEGSDLRLEGSMATCFRALRCVAWRRVKYSRSSRADMLLQTTAKGIAEPLVAGDSAMRAVLLTRGHSAVVSAAAGDRLGPAIEALPPLAP